MPDVMALFTLPTLPSIIPHTRCAGGQGDTGVRGGDELLADGTFVWDIPLDRELYMFANTLYPTSGFPWWLVGLLTLSAGLALGVWLAALRREKKTGAARRPAPEPPSQKPQPPVQKAKPGSPFFDLDAE